jgi:ADP-heptose:LPS heptosyltransferase
MVTFLIIRFSSIGDIVLTTSVVRELKQQVEGARIIYLTKKKFSSVLEHNPYVDKLIVFNDNLTECLQEIEDEKPNHIIDLHNNLRSARIKRKLGLPAFTVNKLNWQKWLLVNLKINRLPNKHIVDRYRDTCSVFDIKDDGKGLDYFVGEKNTVDIVKEFGAKVNDGFIAIVLGAMHFTKQIPEKHIIEICNKSSVPVLLMGGPNEQEKANNILEKSENQELINTCGKYNINQSASIIQQAKVVITADTGLMHIAAAFKKDIISIWGNTVPEFGMYPYKETEKSKRFEVKDLKCRPCSKIGHQACPKKHFHCMEKQDIDSIITTAEELIKRV